MKRRNIVFTSVVLAALMTAIPGVALAQSLGPVTGSVGTADPTNVSFRIGPVMTSTGLAIKSLGVDNNVFDDPVNPKRDWHAVFNPDMTIYLRTGLIRFTLASAADFTYYKKYKSERGINRTLTGRMDFLLSRFRPFIVGGAVQSRDRPNAEIDLRARRSEREAVAGVNVEISPQTFAFAGATRTDYSFRRGEIYRDVELAEQLDRRNESVAAGLRRDLTPLTSVQVVGRVARDRFVSARERDGDATSVETTWTFAPDALFHGELRAGYESFKPLDLTVDAYKGMTMGGRIQWPIFTATRLDLGIDRRRQYSFEETEPYYVQTGTDVTLTQRVFGSIDLQGRGSYQWLTYGHTIAERSGVQNDHVASALAGVGYTLRDQSRVAMNYEFTKRDSDRRNDRIFDRHRIYGSWTYQF